MPIEIFQFQSDIRNRKLTSIKIESVVCFAKLEETGSWAPWTEQHAPYTQFLAILKSLNFKMSFWCLQIFTKPTFFPEFLPQPLKKVKSKHYCKSVKIKSSNQWFKVPLFFLFDLFLGARAEILDFFFVFWKI